jgi:hypothetical protein
MPETAGAARVWALTGDLMLGSQIGSTARVRGVEFKRIEPRQIAELPAEGGILFLDLDLGQEALRDAIAAARSAGPDAWHLCVYGSHVDAEGLRAMRTAGADRVVSRSMLVASLQSILEEVLPARGSETS